ncbi:MAG: TMEM43 family protein [Desulfovibrionaceae bacterium]|nr:TMEM43 family protein [Desulfovibrionaceae bacterium]
MEYTETTSTSWFSRIGSSFGGVVFGIILLVAGTGLLIWNERDFVQTRDALNEALSVTVELPDTRKIEPAFNGQLVHAIGYAETKDMLRDSLFGIGGVGIALERQVEFYQWVEHSKTEKHKSIGGGEETITTYSYAPEWVKHRVDSQQFHAPEARSQYRNFTLLMVENQTQYASHVSLGAYRLPDFLIRAIGGAQPFNVMLDNATKSKLNHDLLTARSNFRPMQTGSLNDFLGSNILLHEQGNLLYVGEQPTMPQIGDVRLSFTMTPQATISIIAKVHGNTFEPFHAANGKDVSSLALGEVSLEKMFADEHSSNATITWILRAVGTILIIIGLATVFKPLAVIASVIPLFGTIVEAGTTLVSVLLGLAWSLIVMAIAWLAFRPVTGLLMLAVACASIFLLYLKGANTRQLRRA